MAVYQCIFLMYSYVFVPFYSIVGSPFSNLLESINGRPQAIVYRMAGLSELVQK